jgi:hypothetical protein
VIVQGRVSKKRRKEVNGMILKWQRMALLVGILSMGILGPALSPAGEWQWIICQAGDDVDEPDGDNNDGEFPVV